MVRNSECACDGMIRLFLLWHLLCVVGHQRAVGQSSSASLRLSQCMCMHASERRFLHRGSTMCFSVRPSVSVCVSMHAMAHTHRRFSRCRLSNTIRLMTCYKVLMQTPSTHIRHCSQEYSLLSSSLYNRPIRIDRQQL